MDWTLSLRKSMHTCMVAGQGTRDLCGPEGLTTEGFVEAVAYHMKEGKLKESFQRKESVSAKEEAMQKVDMEKVKSMFDKYDSNKDGTISPEEFTQMLVKLGVAPMKNLN